MVLHTAPDGRSLPTVQAPGQLLAFRDTANAKSFARGLLEAGLPEAILANLSDIDRSGAAEWSAEVTVFEDCVKDLKPAERRERAHRLALELGPSLLGRY